MSLYEHYKKLYPQLLTMLENGKKNGRLTHSFLVVSDSEEVRRDFPIVLAQLTGCESNVSGAPDTTCDYCSRLERGVYSEYYLLTPRGKTYVIKVGDNDKTEPNTLRDMLDRLSRTSEHHKIGVVLEADRMNDQAQNALLKTLEEPPPDTTIILSTANPASLLPTTRSRCQILNLPCGTITFDFVGKDETLSALNDLCFGEGGLVSAENNAMRLLKVAENLAEEAEKKVLPSFEQAESIIKQLDEPGAKKRLQEQEKDAAAGEYMRSRRQFLGLITVYCSQIFLLSCGVSEKDLPVPELLTTLPRPIPKITPKFGEAVRKEGADLEFTLRFNVQEELAFRTFAVNIAMAISSQH